MSLVAGPGRGHQKTGELKLAVEEHVSYIQSLNERQNELEYHLTEHLRIPGIYWAVTVLHLLGRPDALNRKDLIHYVLSCWHEEGGFGAAPGHDVHLTNTGYAVQILLMLNGLEELESQQPNSISRIGDYIARLQQPDGTFTGDTWGETDTRFVFLALYTLSLLRLLPHQRPEHPPLINVSAATSYIRACQNFDGAFGVFPGAESHAGQVYTCVGALAVAGELESSLGKAGKDKLGAWLSERQLPSGGLNGRPEKLADVCYSWWVISSLAMIDRLHWIDRSKLTNFILQCQDPVHGGLADRPGDMVDVFHTNFGIAGLSLLGYPGLAAVDPTYCLPVCVLDQALGR
ncbi:geranylgeranyl transferase type 2 subunit beta [Piedraia hortae CBS 480.64]|uniref:Geranylgeranyl transferase type-2 subunit beta n=1 Tax=Piedraia hortae CBS 480.64 TaxID=1314780 RepID=A0A6A7C2G0_9PEZI|nr:geranylgeranyl transferase type 2 subunit beta [Piedraia hortae CBS 480.64]